MPKPRMALRMIKDVLRSKWEAGLSHAQTAAALRISKGAVAKYLGLAEAAGLTWEAVSAMEEAQIEAALLPKAAAAGRFAEPDWGRVHAELSRKGVTLMLLWEEYAAAHPGRRTWRYTQFCAHYKAFAASLKRSMRQHRRAGEKLFIDFAGSSVALSGGSRAQVFVASMGASGYTFACAAASQKLEDWVGCMVRALEFYGGVPQLIVPDCPRALVTLPDRYEPRVHDSVLDFARHYGTSVLPARPRKPQDKASAESAVQVVTRWILARLRHQRFDGVAEADTAIGALLHSLNHRPFQKLPGCRASAFAELDRPALSALPAKRYELARFKAVKVHIDYHVEIDAHRYSVPHALVGQALEARITAHGIELLLRGQRVAAHARSRQRGGFTTVEAHMPAAHRAHREWTPSRLVAWGQRIGPCAGEAVTRLLAQNRHPEHGYRACLGLLGLARRYGEERLEAACARALALGSFKYRHIRDLLASGRDRLPAGSAEPSWSSPEHEHVRGPDYFLH